MSTLTPFLSPALSAIPWVSHGFFTREGGMSSGEFSSLNAGLGSGDDAAHVAENRARISAHLGAPLITARQVHSPLVQWVTGDELWIPRSADRASPEPASCENQKIFAEANANRPEVDGLATDKAGISLGALTADCVPVLFADTRTKLIAAAHAGWKGACYGVLDNTIETLLQRGATLATLVAAVGPAIAGASYEVGPELREAFLKERPSADAFFVANTHKNSYQFALPKWVALHLRECGIGVVDELNQDTYANPETFFSYRRSTHQKATDYGRQVSAITIKQDG